MIKKLHFKDSEESRLFACGCLHLNHDPKWPEPIWKIRGFNSAAECTDGIIDSINDTCRASDNLLILGDFCLNTPIEQFWPLVNRILPKLWFIRGNHNNPWEKELLKYSLETYGIEAVNFWWQDKILYLGDYVELVWNKQMFVCHHYPYYVFNNMNQNSISLVSHSHGNCKLSHPSDNTMKQIDCGWDVWRKPIGFEEIMRSVNLKGKPVHDHHSYD